MGRDGMPGGVSGGEAMAPSIFLGRDKIEMNLERYLVQRVSL